MTSSSATTPISAANHQPDVQFTRPVFVGGEIVAFVMTRAHWTDIGGQAPGSYALSTWDVFAEGLRIPPIRLYREDRPVPDLLELIRRNSRNADELLLDIQAQYAGVFVGDRRISDLVGKYGADNLRAAMKRSLDHSETLTREAIRRIPDGVYEAEDVLDPIEAPGWPAESPRLKVKITVDRDRMVFDYAGTGSQVRGGINCPLPVTCNSTWFTVKAITDVSIPINQGCYRPVTILAPEGSVLNCRYPASVVSGNTETSPRVIDLLLKALAPAVPQRVIGQSNCAACAGIFSGRENDPERLSRTGTEFVTMHDVHAGGMGARIDKDGVNGVRVYVGNTGSQSVEMIERSTPLVVEGWGLVPDSGRGRAVPRRPDHAAHLPRRVRRGRRSRSLASAPIPRRKANSAAWPARRSAAWCAAPAATPRTRFPRRAASRWSAGATGYRSARPEAAAMAIRVSAPWRRCSTTSRMDM